MHAVSSQMSRSIHTDDSGVNKTISLHPDAMALLRLGLYTKKALALLFGSPNRPLKRHVSPVRLVLGFLTILDDPCERGARASSVHWEINHPLFGRSWRVDYVLATFNWPECGSARRLGTSGVFNQSLPLQALAVLTTDPGDSLQSFDVNAVFVSNLVFLFPTKGLIEDHTVLYSAFG
ncbi:hypothetical protein BC834DRAFT_144089 [Gloeopeniophorella convolvens]|nr:hypothetical protein BC834DRAFT_144089 [Gloeopeniophorella convolvens]